jgi:uridine kinase
VGEPGRAERIVASRADAEASAHFVVDAALHASANPVVLIDGPSGAGKSTFADDVAATWPTPSAVLVRMDDVYPGWHGLAAAAAHVHDELLAPLRAGRAGRWRRWDWATSAPAEWHMVEPGHPLIVEGCGCLTRASAQLADLRVWLTAADGVRKQRALARDAGAFDAHWDDWQRQWDDFVAAEHPRRGADVVLETTRALGTTP